jgi:glyoxylase-like metal-dependent hydrolase (beta-lactamase superfamily II)
MRTRRTVGLFCLIALAGAAWVAGRDGGEGTSADAWKEVAPSVFRSPGLPAGYALVEDGHALLIDAPRGADGLKRQGVKLIDAVLLTHHHRDTAAAAGRFLAERIPVRAPAASAVWLTPENVRKYWHDGLPLRDSRTSYLVLPEGLDGVDCSLTEKQAVEWRGWTIRVVDTPGHARDHAAFVAQKGKEGRRFVFCGGTLSAPGKMATPYTLDWDHWTDAGMKPAAASLHKLAALKPDVLLPAHGDVIGRDPVRALEQTAAAVEEVAFLKSFERFTKERLKNPPDYPFLAKEQSATNGSKPWSRLSEHLFLTGNTYVLVSKDGSFLVVDPWDPHSAKQIPKLKADQKLGPLEVVLCSHAHFDHYDGVYAIFEREKPEVWTLDRVAEPIAEPFKLQAPFLDARPVRVARRPKDGETLTWREYRLRFRHLPGQTDYTMGVETTIDGKRCFFTADNFFHQDQYSGTGGWMGLNRSWPLPYADSAQKVLDAAPDWVLAEHGSAMAFNAEDFRRRVAWGKAAVKAADALSPSGNHRYDWDPHRIHVEPILQKGRPSATLRLKLVVENHLDRKEALQITLEGRGLVDDQTINVDVPSGKKVEREFSLRLSDRLPAGRHVFMVKAVEGDVLQGADAFLAIDVD